MYTIDIQFKNGVWYTQESITTLKDCEEHYNMIVKINKSGPNPVVKGNVFDEELDLVHVFY